MKILKKTENPLFSRMRLKIEIEHLNQPTPKKEEISKKIADSLKTKQELVKIEHIYTKFSPGISDVIAYVYKDEKALKKVQIKKKIKKKPTSTEQKPLRAPSEQKSNAQASIPEEKQQSQKQK